MSPQVTLRILMFIGLCALSASCQSDESQPPVSPEDASTHDAEISDTAVEMEISDTAVEMEISDGTTEELPQAFDAEVVEEDPVEMVETTLDLVDNAGWLLAPSDADPWYGDGSKASDELCEPDSYQLEFTPDGEWFEVDTSFCGYLTVRQALTVDVPSGATVTVQMEHEIISEGAGPYILGIGMGDPAESVWETEVPVPSL